MLLAIDVGNTNITIGVFHDDSLLFESRIATDWDRMQDQYAVELLDILRLYKMDAHAFDGAAISSVVPPMNLAMRRAVEKITGIVPMLVGPGTKTGIDIRIDNPSQLGSDMLVGAVAAVSKYGSPCIIWDLGTATKASVIDKNGIFRGATITAGVDVSIQSLAQRTAQLFSISLEPPEHVIGTNTIHSMQSGAVYGTASMIDGMCERIELELGYPVTAVITGGLGREISEQCRRKIIFDSTLVLDGLNILYKKNKK